MLQRAAPAGVEFFRLHGPSPRRRQSGRCAAVLSGLDREWPRNNGTFVAESGRLAAWQGDPFVTGAAPLAVGQSATAHCLLE